MFLLSTIGCLIGLTLYYYAILQDYKDDKDDKKVFIKNLKTLGCAIGYAILVTFIAWSFITQGFALVEKNQRKIFQQRQALIQEQIDNLLLNN